MWFVYVLLCADGSLYTGITKNPGKRLSDHKNGRGGAYTRSHKPLKMVYTEEKPDKPSALRRELEIKGWSRSKKIEILIPDAGGSKILKMENKYLHEVVITAIIRKGKKYLVTKRSASKKRFPGKWTVPGGKLETKDYTDLPKDTNFYWYNVLEKTLKREVAEETGLTVNNITYITSLATIHEDGFPSLVISCLADYQAGEVRLQKSEAEDFAWVTIKEAGSYDFIDGIFEELVMASRVRTIKKQEWKRS